MATITKDRKWERCQHPDHDNDKNSLGTWFETPSNNPKIVRCWKYGHEYPRYYEVEGRSRKKNKRKGPKPKRIGRGLGSSNSWYDKDIDAIKHVALEEETY
jgi:hypothetical protein